MPLARQTTLGPTREPAVESAALNIIVIFTSVSLTLHALKAAAGLAARLNGTITLVVPQVVNYPLPLTSPPVLLEFSERRFRAIAEQCPVPVSVHIHLCRDRTEALQAVLQPHSLVMIGARQRWWPTAEMRLARQLMRSGHEVILTDGEVPHA